jgi:hypothetical protein
LRLDGLGQNSDRLPQARLVQARATRRARRHLTRAGFDFDETNVAGFDFDETNVATLADQSNCGRAAAEGG